MRFYGVKFFQNGQNFIFRNSRAPLGKKHSVDMFIVPMRDLMCILGSTYYGLTLLSWTDILHTHIYLIYIKYPVFWNFQLCCSRNRQAGQGVRHPKKSTQKKVVLCHQQHSISLPLTMHQPLFRHLIVKVQRIIEHLFTQANFHHSLSTADAHISEKWNLVQYQKFVHVHTTY